MAKPTEREIQEVFDYWVEKHRTSNRGPRPVLGEKRHQKIEKAIRMYGVQTCKDAIDGCLLSDWHMGANPRNKIYDDIELILRNESKIERFAELKLDARSTGMFDPLK